jgi:hypothetical protein
MDIGDSGVMAKYPQIGNRIPPNIPQPAAGFHSTALDGKRHKVVDFIRY